MEKTLTKLHANYNSETNVKVPSMMHLAKSTPARFGSTNRLKDN